MGLDFNNDGDAEDDNKENDNCIMHHLDGDLGPPLIGVAHLNLVIS